MFHDPTLNIMLGCVSLSFRRACVFHGHLWVKLFNIPWSLCHIFRCQLWVLEPNSICFQWMLGFFISFKVRTLDTFENFTPTWPFLFIYCLIIKAIRISSTRSLALFFYMYSTNFWIPNYFIFLDTELLYISELTSTSSKVASSW